MSKNWSDLTANEKALAVIAALAAGHRSARDIFPLIGAPSRDAVIGVANRNGITLQGRSGMASEQGKRVWRERSARPDEMAAYTKAISKGLKKWWKRRRAAAISTGG